jgi:hypothetical protein
MYGRCGLVVSSPPATVKTGAMGRVIEFRRGIHKVLAFSKKIAACFIDFSRQNIFHFSITYIDTYVHKSYTYFEQLHTYINPTSILNSALWKCLCTYIMWKAFYDAYFHCFCVHMHNVTPEG